MTVVSPLGYGFPGGTYTIAHWENWLLTDCTTAEPLPNNLAHPVALFHVPILGAGTSITELFEVCGAEGPGSVGLDGYDWEYMRPLRVGVEYRMEGGIVRWEQLVDERGNPYDSMSFSIDMFDAEGLAARITNTWRFRRRKPDASEGATS